MAAEKFTDRFLSPEEREVFETLQKVPTTYETTRMRDQKYLSLVQEQDGISVQNYLRQEVCKYTKDAKTFHQVLIGLLGKCGIESQQVNFSRSDRLAGPEKVVIENKYVEVESPARTDFCINADVVGAILAKFPEPERGLV